MDNQTLLQASGYIALGIAAWPICKYAIKPLVEGVFSNKHELEALNNMIATYEKCYIKTVEERARAATELGKAGRNGKEISDILDSTLPFPEAPDTE